MHVRIIPRLEIKGNNLVKGVQLEGLRVLGDPSAFAKLYDYAGADELLYVDIVASLYDRSIDVKVISRTSRAIQIPLTVGGGVRTLQDIETLLAAGADKVAINTAAVNRPEFINEAAKEFGSQCVVASIEAKQLTLNDWEVYTLSGRQPSGRKSLEWALETQSRGAGEILLTSVDREGTCLGFDNALAGIICENLSIPVLIAGGAGDVYDVESLLEQTRPDGVCCSSIFHYYCLEQAYNAKNVDPALADILRGIPHYSVTQQAVPNLTPTSVNRMKEYLVESGYPILSLRGKNYE
jgi:cyclase